MFKEYNPYDRHRVTLHCLITLKSPLSHIGKVTGNVSNLKTLTLLDIEGNPRECLTYSGNALRNGILRRRGTAAALESLGLMVNPDVHHTLFAGGRIDGSTGNNMELDKQIRQLMPWLSVLGTAKPAGVFGVKDAQMVQGRLAVGSAYLVCYESVTYLWEQCPGVLPPETISPIRDVLEAKEALSADIFSLPSDDAIEEYRIAKEFNLPIIRKYLKLSTEHITLDQTTRRDSTQDSELTRFLSNQALLKGNTGKEKKSDQMIANDRLIMAGSRLYSRWDFYGTDVEEGFIIDALLKFSESPYLGGKSNRGNGLVGMQFWFDDHQNKGDYLTVSATPELSLRASEKHDRWKEYLSRYQEYLAEAQSSTELRGLLGA